MTYKRETSWIISCLYVIDLCTETNWNTSTAGRGVSVPGRYWQITAHKVAEELPVEFLPAVFYKFEQPAATAQCNIQRIQAVWWNHRRLTATSCNYQWVWVEFHREALCWPGEHDSVIWSMIWTYNGGKNVFELLYTTRHCCIGCLVSKHLLFCYCNTNTWKIIKIR